MFDAYFRLLGDEAGPAPADDTCPACGWDIDRWGGNPACPTCAAEPDGQGNPPDQVVILGRAPDGSVIRGVAPDDRAGGLTRYDDPLDDLPLDLDPWYAECPDCGHGHTAMTTADDCGPCGGCADLLGLRGRRLDGDR